MEWLKELLKDKVSEDILEDTLQSINSEFPKYAIPKNVYNEKAEELKAIKSQLEETKTMTEQLKEKAGSVEEYEKNLAEWKLKYEDLENKSQSEISNITKKTQLKELLLEEKANKDIIDLLVDRYSADAEVLEGKLKEPSVLIEKIKSERAGAFAVVEANSKPPEQGQGTGEKPISEMTDDEYIKSFNEREHKY